MTLEGQEFGSFDQMIATSTTVSASISMELIPSVLLAIFPPIDDIPRQTITLPNKNDHKMILGYY